MLSMLDFQAKACIRMSLHRTLSNIPLEILGFAKYTFSGHWYQTSNLHKCFFKSNSSYCAVCTYKLVRTSAVDFRQRENTVCTAA